MSGQPGMAGRPKLSPKFGRRLWLAGAGIIFTALLLVISTAFRPLGPGAGAPVGRQPVGKTPDEMLAAEEEYRNAVYSIFRPWKDSNGEKADYAGLQAALLALTVPGGYRTVHLDLAISLGMLHDGLATPDDTMRAAGREKIREVFSAHPWILAARDGEEAPEPKLP